MEKRLCPARIILKLFSSKGVGGDLRKGISSRAALMWKRFLSLLRSALFFSFSLRTVWSQLKPLGDWPHSLKKREELKFLLGTCNFWRVVSTLRTGDMIADLAQIILGDMSLEVNVIANESQISYGGIFFIVTEELGLRFFVFWSQSKNWIIWRCVTVS